MKELISPKDIDIQTKIVAKQISDKHRGDKTPVVMIGLLNGCFAFYADLVRAMHIDVECDFMRVKSYINRKQGDIVIAKDLETPIKGKHVYVVDDIYDTGNTMKVVSLVTRKSSPTPPVKMFNAFEIDNEWLVGFGMDDEKGYCRNLPAIYSL